LDGFGDYLKKSKRLVARIKTTAGAQKWPSVRTALNIEDFKRFPFEFPRAIARFLRTKPGQIFIICVPGYRRDRATGSGC
jgi:hypothetical protein